MRWRTDARLRDVDHSGMDTPSRAPSRPGRDSSPLDDEWLELGRELRGAQRAKLDFLAELGRRVGHRRGAAGAHLEEPDTETLAALQHAIDGVDERMRRFIADDVNRRVAAPAVRQNSMHGLA